MNVDNDMVLYIILWMFAFFFILKIMGWNGPEDPPLHQNRWYNDEKTKKYRQLEKENITLETMKIKKEEVENDIDKLKLEASMNFEKEAENETKIRKLELQVKQLNIKIREKENDIYDLSYEIQWMN